MLHAFDFLEVHVSGFLSHGCFLLGLLPLHWPAARSTGSVLMTASDSHRRMAAGHHPAETRSLEEVCSCRHVRSAGLTCTDIASMIRHDFRQ